MPWNTTPTPEQRLKFVTLAKSGRFTVRELCEQFGISRKCGHKWLVRFAQGGAKALQDASRAPHHSPQRTSEELERIIVSERRLHPTWGPKKLRVVLERKHAIELPPAVSTLGEILKRNGLIESRRRRPGAFEVKRGELTEATRPNHVWATDFKGWFYTQDKERCDPLTVTDLFSRYLIGVQALPQATQKWTRQAYMNFFRVYGLPEIIRMDNGSPFGSIGPGGLSKLTVWWISLGIDVEFIKPASPQQNGSHERMHRTLQEECCKPTALWTLAAGVQRGATARGDRAADACRGVSKERCEARCGHRRGSVWTVGAKTSCECDRKRVVAGAGLACGGCLCRTRGGV
jgi:transposase InsO family protein